MLIFNLRTLLKILFVAGSVFYQINVVAAKDLGVHGKVFEIKEESVLTQIEKQLERANKEGKIAALQKDLEKKTFQKVNKPNAVKGISATTQNKEWDYDPSIALDYDLKDQDGKLFYKAGTKVNPLDKISLSKALIFIDGDDLKQVEWALHENKKRKSKTKLILVKGAVIDLMRSKKVRFYFDQNGILINKFGIKHVPALVEQGLILNGEEKGKKILKVREVLL